MDPSLDELIPVNEALALASTPDHVVTLDKWEWLVDSGLMRGPERIPGTNRYGITRRRAFRLKAILELERSIESAGRITGGRLAFWACYAGFEVIKPSLVAEALEEDFTFIYRAIRREISRLGPGYDLSTPVNFAMATEIATYAVKTWTTPSFLEKIPLVGSQIHEFKVAVFRTIVLLLFGGGPDARADLYNSTLPIAKSLFDDSASARLVAADFSKTEGDEAWLKDPKIMRNKALTALHQAAASSPEKVVAAITRSRKLLGRLGLLINSDATSRYPTATVRPSREQDMNKIVRALPAGTAVVMLYFESTGNFDEFLRNIDDDVPTRIEKGLRKMIELANNFLDKLGVK